MADPKGSYTRKREALTDPVPLPWENHLRAEYTEAVTLNSLRAPKSRVHVRKERHTGGEEVFPPGWLPGVSNRVTEPPCRTGALGEICPGTDHPAEHGPWDRTPLGQIRPGTEPPGTDPPWDRTPRDRSALGQNPPGQIRPGTEAPLGQNLPGTEAPSGEKLP